MDPTTEKRGSNGMAAASAGAQETTALVRREDVATLAASPYEPRNYDEARAIAKDFAGSKLTKCRTPEQALLVMATGRELGIPATTALRMIYVADFGQGDQVALSSDLMVALCLRSPMCEYFDCIEASDERATYATKRRGRPERRFTFTDADRIKAKLGFNKEGKEPPDSNWAKYRRTMLMHRAASLLAREVFPDVIGGFYTAEELRDAAILDLRVVEPEVRPLTTLGTAGAGDRVSVTEKGTAMVPAIDPEAEAERAARWERALLDARSAEEGKLVTAEIKAALPEEHPTRRALANLLAERKKAKWAPPAQEEPPHDARTGEVIERQLGEDDE